MTDVQARTAGRPTGDESPPQDDNRSMRRPQRRAVLPDRSGFAERGDVRLAFEAFDRGAAFIRPPVLLLPTWQIIASQLWKCQVGPLSRHHRVVSYVGRGSGRSSHSVGAAAYTDLECAQDI